MSEEHLCTLCISIIEFDGPDPGGLGVLLSSSRLGILVALVPLGSHLVTHLLHLHTANQMSDGVIGFVWVWSWHTGEKEGEGNRRKENEKSWSGHSGGLHTANQMSRLCRWRRVGVVWAQWRGEEVQGFFAQHKPSPRRTLPYDHA